MRRSGNAYVSSGFGGQNKEKVSYCQDCEKVKILSPLRHRIYLDADDKITTPAADANKWRQCWTCGVIVGVYAAKPEVELDTLTEPRANPFKFNSGTVKLGNLGRLTGPAKPRGNGNSNRIWSSTMRTISSRHYGKVQR